MLGLGWLTLCTVRLCPDAYCALAADALAAEACYVVSYMYNSAAASRPPQLFEVVKELFQDQGAF